MRHRFLTLADSAPGLSLHRGNFFARSCADATQRRIYIRVASTNRGLRISRLECCAINSGCEWRFHPPAPPTLGCSFFGASRRCLPGCRFRFSLSSFLADHARETLDSVKLRPRRKRWRQSDSPSRQERTDARQNDCSEADHSRKITRPWCRRCRPLQGTTAQGTESPASSGEPQ